jgi:RimJ/RimL family protein N-acetyltransferase
MLCRLFQVNALRFPDFFQIRSPYYTRDPRDGHKSDFDAGDMSFYDANKYLNQAKRLFLYEDCAQYCLKFNPNSLKKINKLESSFKRFCGDCFLLFYKGELIGRVKFYPVANLKEVSCSYALLPGFIGKGLGTKLVANIEKYCKVKFSRYDYISLYIKHDNFPSLRTAEKNGFTPQNKTPLFSRGMGSYKLIKKI